MHQQPGGCCVQLAAVLGIAFWSRMLPLEELMAILHFSYYGLRDSCWNPEAPSYMPGLANTFSNIMDCFWMQFGPSAPIHPAA